MLVDTHVFTDLIPEGQGSDLVVSAKRYYTENSAKKSDSCAFTLILAHGNGHHKELFQPLLEHLFDIQEGGRVGVREAWALDWQSHGDSAILNAGTLGADEVVSISVYGRAIAGFALSAHIHGPVIAIGHSAGSSAIMYSTRFFKSDEIPYEAILIVEPPMIDHDVYQGHIDDREQQIKFITTALGRGRASWPDKASALEYLSKRPPCGGWDRRVLELYVEHGLYQPPGRQEVVLKCPKSREAAAYVDFESTFAATDQIAPTSARIPLHFIFGAKNDFVPRYSQDSLLDTSKGRRPASVIRVEEAGHLVVQEVPERLAKVIYDVLKGQGSRPKL